MNRKGKVTAVLVSNYMKNIFETVAKIKNQYSMIDFVLLNPEGDGIPEKYSQYFSLRIN